MFSPENLTKYRSQGSVNINNTRIKSGKATLASIKPVQDEEQNTQVGQVVDNYEQNLLRIIEMMESKYTEQLTDRHVNAIQKLVDEMNVNNLAFFYKDLQTLSKLISIIFKRIAQDNKTELIPQLISVIKICNRPFVKEKTSDELNFVPKTVFFLNALCGILQHNNSQDEDMYMLFLECMSFLNDFAGFGIDEYKNQDADYHMKKLYGNNFSLLNTLQTEGTRNLRLISSSNVLETLVYIVTNNHYDENSTIVVINTMLNCALYRNNAEKLAGLGVLKDLVQIISNTNDFRSLLVRVCIEAIWNILENGGKKACRMMAFEEIVNSLFHTFNTVIKNCFRLEDRNIRNDICILINYVVSSPESHMYFIYRDEDMPGGMSMTGINTGRVEGNKDLNRKSFLEILLHYATYDEATVNKEREIEKEFKEKMENSLGMGLSSKKGRSFIDPNEFFLSTSPDDIEFKKIIWTSILYIIKDNHSKPEIIEVLKHYSFLHCLLLYLEPEAMKYSCISRWQQPQLKDLQILCLSILLNIIPLYQQYFEETRGYSTLIKFLQIYSDKDRRQICLKTINNIINSDVIKKELTEEKLIDFLLEIINNSSENSLESREYSFNIISQMCMSNKLAQKEFRRKGGIEILKKNLNYQSILDQIGNQKIFILVVLDCLWNAVIGNKRNEEQFIELDGLFTLFELLEQSDDIHIKIILSCVASLVDNKRSFSYFIQWKSNSNSNIDATRLLINIYRDEDRKYGVEYENGILQNHNGRPLNPKTSYYFRKNEKLKNEEDERRRMKNTKKTTRESLFIDRNGDQGIPSEKTQTSGVSNLISNTSYSNTNFNDENIYRSEDFIESFLNHKISEITKNFDLRETIFSIFYRIGFNNITITSSEDKQTFVIIKMYPAFKNLENWKDVVEELEDLKVNPISDDMNWIMSQIEESEEKCKAAIRQQEIIYENIKKSQGDELKEYFNKIKTISELKNKNIALKVREKDHS